jgi:putative redox protein
VSEQQVIWAGEDFRFEGRDANGHTVEIDAEVTGSGAKPADLLPISLAACTAWDVVNILRKQRQDLRGLQVDIRSEQEPHAPWAFKKIHMAFIITGAVDPAKALRAIELSEEKYCAVAATIRATVTITHSLELSP